MMSIIQTREPKVKSVLICLNRVAGIDPFKEPGRWAPKKVRPNKGVKEWQQ